MGKTKGQRKAENKRPMRRREKTIDYDSAPKQDIMQGRTTRRKWDIGLAKGDKV